MSEFSIGAIDALPEGQGSKLDVGGETVAVFKVDDEVYAIADRCSHAEASLAEGDLFGLHVECPRHGAEFSIEDGAAQSLPATKPVRTFPTRVADGEVHITIESEPQHG